MRMNKQEAQRLVEAELEKTRDECSHIDCAVLESETIERPWGWVFFYESKKFIEAGNFREMLGGNSPIMVNRNTGELTFTGTAYDMEHYIKDYEATL
jgi:hypothetical protein